MPLVDLELNPSPSAPSMERHFFRDPGIQYQLNKLSISVHFTKMIILLIVKELRKKVKCTHKLQILQYLKSHTRLLFTYITYMMIITMLHYSQSMRILFIYTPKT